MKNRCIMGGSFDPSHMGHLILGENARSSLNLDKVIIFIPTGTNPFKRDGATSSSNHKG